MTRRFTLGDEVLSLSPREQAALRVSVQRSGEPVSRQQLMDRVFSDEQDVQSSAVDVLLHRLRRRLDGSGVRIHTYRGLGYVLRGAASAGLVPGPACGPSCWRCCCRPCWALRP